MPQHSFGASARACAMTSSSSSREIRTGATLAKRRALLDGLALERPNTVRTVATVMAGHAQQLVSLELISRR
jgi:hypothetical protein